MIILKNVTKLYLHGEEKVHAIQSVNLSVQKGEFLTVVGPSGSGKSTMLLTIGGMLRPTKGMVTVRGTDIYALSNRERARFRAERIGFVFQMFHLFPYLNVLENVLLPRIAGINRGAHKEAFVLLEQFGLSDRIRHKPSELSTGECQRVAMVRALLNHPELLLADEPTGNLDPKNTFEIMDFFKEFHKRGGTIVLVSHEILVKGYTDRTVILQNGRIEREAIKMRCKYH